MIRKRKWLKRVIWALIIGICFAFLISIFAWRDLSSARSNLEQAKSVLDSLQSNVTNKIGSRTGRSETEVSLAKALTSANAAEQKINSSLSLDVLDEIPLVNTQINGVKSIASDADAAIKMGQQLLAQLDHISGAGSFQNGQIPLGQISSLQVMATQDSNSIQSMIKPASGLVSSISAARNDFNKVATKLDDELVTASQSLAALEVIVGKNGPERFLLIGDNNAEMRDQGMALSVSTVTFDNGHFTTTPANSISSLALKSPVDVPIPSGTSQVFGELQPNYLWQSVNATANFQWSGSTMLAMAKENTGIDYNGVIAIDVPALADLLAVTGPVNVAGIATPLTSQNVSQVLLNDLYVNVPAGNQVLRHEEIAAAADAVLSRLKEGSNIDLVSLAKALGNATAGRHLLIYSSDPHLEAIFNSDGISGNPAVKNASRTFHVAVENATATKLDYFIDPSISTSIYLTKYGNAIISTKVTIVNTAPIGAKPSYQLGPDYINSFSPGEYVGRLEFWGPSGSEQLGSISESGLRLNEVPFKVFPGKSTTITIQTTIPNAVINGEFGIQYIPQPRMEPVPVKVSINSPYWIINSNKVDSTTLDKTQVFTWQLYPKKQ
ncbi:MAG: DUF4012 domain-containing protein [Acidimicrobiales bacterium]|nr:DUF4012 domain-containing protein [Acidimicrobiales bacterium]